MNVKMICLLVASAMIVSANAKGTTEADYEKLEQKFGGFVIKPGKGQIGVVNCQDRVPSNVVATSAVKMGQNIGNYNVAVAPGKKCAPGQLPTRASADNVAVFVVDDASLPMSLIAPESQWGLVNVASLASDNPSVEKLNERFLKAFLRVSALTTGAGLKGSASLTTVSGLAELDAQRDIGIPVESLENISENLTKLGLTPPFRSTYKRACREGWAPAPTNASQKAVWDKIHQSPTKPIVIAPEKTKQP